MMKMYVDLQSEFFETQFWVDNEKKISFRLIVWWLFVHERRKWLGETIWERGTTIWRSSWFVERLMKYTQELQNVYTFPLFCMDYKKKQTFLGWEDVKCSSSNVKSAAYTRLNHTSWKKHSKGYLEFSTYMIRCMLRS